MLQRIPKPLEWGSRQLFGKEFTEGGRPLQPLTLLAQDWVDPDREVRDDESFRIQGGMQIIVYPGVTIDVRIRFLAPAVGGSDADLFIQLHVWN